MTSDQIPIERLRWERPPAVVLGDLSLIRPLGWARIPVILATPAPDSVASRSRYLLGCCRIPELVSKEARAEAARALVHLGARLTQTLGLRVPLFYQSDKDLELLYEHREALEQRYLFVLNEEDTAWSLHDKQRFAGLCERLGIRAPRSVPPGEEAEARIAALTEPLVVKPIRKTAWKELKRDLFDGSGKARVFERREELLGHPGYQRHRDEVLVQEHIPGGVERLLSFHAFASREGHLLGWFCGRKIRTFPAVAGESCFIEVVSHPACEAEGRAVIKAIGLRGPCKIDFIEDARTGLLHTLEINARFTLWNVLGAAAGANLPRMAYDYLVEGRTPALELTPTRDRQRPRRWLNFYDDYRAFLEQRQDGGMSVGSWLASIADPTIVHEVFALGDPAPFARWVGDVVRSLVRARLAA
jgi:predicted ATP-grasp superfamily ATP-dependent carboligase